MKSFRETQTETNTGWGRSVWFVGIVFLLLNCSARLGVLFTGSSFLIQVLGLSGIVLCLLPLFKPSWLKASIFCFALTFPLYGSFSYSTHAFLFELYLNFLALTLSVTVYKAGSFSRGSGLLQCILFLYGILSCASLLLLPIQQMAWQLLLWDWNIFWNAVFFATPELSLYSVAALNRLVLYILCAILLSSCQEAKELYRAFFVGLLVAAFWASVIGILDYYKFIDLRRFRDVFDDGLRLQSVFANPGWFAEYLAVIIPYILLGFLSSELQKTNKICLFGILIVCEIAIILTYSRTGWIIYPFVLIVCWFFFYVATRTDSGRCTWKQVGKVSLQVVISVPLTICVSYFLIFHVFDLLNSSACKDSNKFEQRISQMKNPAARKVIWEESLEMVKEKPLFGYGYESFKLHNTILKKVTKEWDTPHNLYLQLLVSGGIAGLILWGILIFATLYLLVADLIKNKTYFNIAVILSIVAFHLYGLAQAMQYIPMIWFLIFVNIGYAMTINGNVLPDWFRRKETAFTGMLILVVLIGVISYASDFESRKLAAKGNMKIYSADQEQNNYLGFYPSERWKEQGIYRWTGSSAIIKLPRSELFELTFVCGAPDLENNPLVLSVYEGPRQIDEVTFFQQESITKKYFISQARSVDKKLYFQVSRTWNLKKLGVANDTRNLGVAISEIKVIEEMPIDGVGFYHWEMWQGSPLPEKNDDSFQYRWTGREAVFNPQQLDRDKSLYFRAGQPGLPDKPLFVQIWQKKKVIKSLQLADTEWHRISLQNVSNLSEPCVITVARTWVAKKTGVGEDKRTLGVAVAGLARGDIVR
ncbi:MAG: O-antigen ligase family protein [Proteobacteria bacterium]|nr:O-antigen ligase family protein [Pseudomonadota bacterium]